MVTGVCGRRTVTHGGQETDMENVHTRGLSPFVLFVQSVTQQAMGWRHPHAEQVSPSPPA